MHPLHEYIARQVAEWVKARVVVVWYDPRREFEPFVAELLDGVPIQVGPVGISLGDVKAEFAYYCGSMFEIRAVVEPLVTGDEPRPLVVYVPGVSPEPTGSVLMELEKAGYRYETQLKRLARNLLRQQYTDGVIDDLLERDGIAYDDLARAAMPGGDKEPSILKGIYHDIPGRDEMLAAWMAGDDRDEDIAAKGAVDELVRLVASRTGLALNATDSLAKLRTVACRYVLVGEFLDDLKGAAPANVQAIATPKTKPELEG